MSGNGGKGFYPWVDFTTRTWGIVGVQDERGAQVAVPASQMVEVEARRRRSVSRSRSARTLVERCDQAAFESMCAAAYSARPRAHCSRNRRMPRSTIHPVPAVAG